MPLGFTKLGKNGKKMDLDLKKTLYGLCQSPRVFQKYTPLKLEGCGLAQSKFDPCLFIGPEVICDVYVDDLIFWAEEAPKINKVPTKLHDLDVDFEQGVNAVGHLRVTQLLVILK